MGDEVGKRFQPVSPALSLFNGGALIYRLFLHPQRFTSKSAFLSIYNCSNRQLSIYRSHARLGHTDHCSGGYKEVLRTIMSLLINHFMGSESSPLIPIKASCCARTGILRWLGRSLTRS